MGMHVPAPLLHEYSAHVLRSELLITKPMLLVNRPATCRAHVSSWQLLQDFCVTVSCCSCPAGASRTDAGAHAVGQVAHLDVVGSPDSLEPDSLMMYLNGVLPPDVKVQHIDLAPPGQ